MQRPVISLIIPTYARPQQLAACLDALMLQTFSEPWELVVVDDGSPEPVMANHSIFQFSQLRGPVVRIIRQSNAGPASARNQGVAAADGELIAFTDDDCRPEPNWLQMMVTSWRCQKQALVGGSTVNGLPKSLFPSASQLIVDLVYAHFNINLDYAYFLASNNMLCTKWQFQEMGGFDISFPRAGAEDRDFCDRWRVAGWPIIWNPDACIEHRHHQNLSKFIDLHFRYGRGAYIYQKKRKERSSGNMQADLGFHRSLPRLLINYQWCRFQKNQRSVDIIAILILWQFANASGFALEALLALFHRSRVLLKRAI